MVLNLNAISLFSSSGIGDLGLHENGINTVIASELLEERMKLFLHNNPHTKGFNGNIWDLQDDIIEYYREHYDESPFLVLATPPCQGMSTNGMGKMLNSFRKGLRPQNDERNRLIIPAIHIIKALQPEWVILENVSNMGNTLILDEGDELINIIDYIHRELGPSYVGEPMIVDTANYGVPQHRTRLFTVLSRNENAKAYFDKYGTLMPKPTHSKHGDLHTEKWITLREVIGELPTLRAEKGRNIDKTNPLHKVPIVDAKKLYWLDNTPEGQTAFNNQCINPSCLFKDNPTHGARKNHQGIHKLNTDTPLHCSQCGEILPRPYVKDKATGEKRIMKGFTSIYKRINWDTPSSTLTQNFQYVCSDNNVHPEQTRALSLLEGLKLQTISDFPYDFNVDGVQVKDSLIRDSIGESVPPRMLALITKNIIDISNTDDK